MYILKLEHFVVFLIKRRYLVERTHYVTKYQIHVCTIIIAEQKMTENNF